MITQNYDPLPSASTLCGIERNEKSTDSYQIISTLRHSYPCSIFVERERKAEIPSQPKTVLEQNAYTTYP